MQKPKVLLISTGGTISSSFDPATGYSPALTGIDILSTYPGIGDTADIAVIQPCNVLSFALYLVMVDLDKEYCLSATNIKQYSDYIIYEGMKVRGYPEMTMVRGKVVAENGVIKAEDGWGQFVSR